MNLYNNASKASSNQTIKWNKIITRFALPFGLWFIVGMFGANMLRSFIEFPWWLHNALIGAVLGGIGVFYKFVTTNDRKYRHGIEHGSAKWGKSADIAPFLNPKLDKNLLFSATEGLNLERPPNDDHERNKNVMIFGGPGTGKTQGYVIPNILQLHASYVITDPKGEILASTGRILKKSGYIVKVFNMKEKHLSHCYNPFQYIRAEHAVDDIIFLLDAIIENTNKTSDQKDTPQGSDPFWQLAETSLLSALFCYVYFRVEAEEQKNIDMVWRLLTMVDFEIAEGGGKMPLDIWFDEWEIDEKNHYGVEAYNSFRKGANKTMRSVVMQATSRMRKFITPELRLIMQADEMELDKVGDRKTALFIILDDTKKTDNFLAGIMYTQLFNVLSNKAENVYLPGKALPIHVRMILDEFANIGKIPLFEQVITTIRSRNISANVILQGKSQIDTHYGEAAHTIIAGCDTEIFLGGKDEKTLKYFVEKLGKETIDTRSDSTSSQSNSLSHQKIGRELMTTTELEQMSNKKCIVSIRGAIPFKSDKYDVTKHPRSNHTLRANQKNAIELIEILEPASYMEQALLPIPQILFMQNKQPNVITKTDASGIQRQLQQIDIGVSNAYVAVDHINKVMHPQYTQDVADKIGDEKLYFEKIIKARAYRILVRNKFIKPRAGDFERIDNIKLWGGAKTKDHIKINVGMPGLYVAWQENVLKLVLLNGHSFYKCELEAMEQLALSRASKIVKEKLEAKKRKERHYLD